MPKDREESVQSRLVVDNGVKSLVPFPEEPCHTRKRHFLRYAARLHVCALMSWPGLQIEQQRGELELESTLDGACRRVAEGGGEKVQGVSRGL